MLDAIMVSRFLNRGGLRLGARSPGAAALALVCGLCLGGCLSPSQVEGFRAGIPIEVSGDPLVGALSLDVDIRNVRGPVTVIVDSELNAPEVRVIPRSPGEPRSDQLEGRATQTADLSREGDAALLKVLASPFDPTDRDIRVAVEIRVPRCDELIVRSAGGDVTAIGVSGPVNILCGAPGENAGDIRVQTESHVVGPMLLATAGGDVTLLVGERSSGEFVLTSENGVARLEATEARVERASNAEADWSGIVNGGEDLFELRTRDGDVRVVVGPGRWNSRNVRLRDDILR